MQSIFLYYCGSSVQGSESIASATKIGLQEMLAFAKDSDICTKEFKVDEIQRHFSSANAEANGIAGGSDRHKQLPGKRRIFGRALFLLLLQRPLHSRRAPDG